MSPSFCAAQLSRLKPLWDKMLGHRFLLQTRAGTIADETFARWMRQDYLFVEAAIPFMAALLSRAPRHHWKPLGDAIAALDKELDLFRERAGAMGVDLAGAPPSLTNHAYIQFLMATALRGSYAEAYTVLYAAEKAYHDSWRVVQHGIAEDSKWYPFVEHWAGNAFAQYVAYLEGELNTLAERAGPDERQRMAELFELATKYEIAFWEMAATGEGWPGLKDGER